MSLRLSTGLRNALAGQKALPHAVLTGINGAFVDGAGGNDSITDAGNSLVTKGFEINDWIKVFPSDSLKMSLEKAEEALHELCHKSIVQLVHGVCWQVIMRIAIKRRVSNHDCLETVIPKGSVVTESY